MTGHAARIVPLIAPDRRRRSPEQRVAYELARLRVADRREPPLALLHLARSHD